MIIKKLNIRPSHTINLLEPVAAATAGYTLYSYVWPGALQTLDTD